MNVVLWIIVLGVLALYGSAMYDSGWKAGVKDMMDFVSEAEAPDDEIDDDDDEDHMRKVHV